MLKRFTKQGGKVVKCKSSALQSKLYQQMLRYNMLYAGDPANGSVPVTIKTPTIK